MGRKGDKFLSGCLPLRAELTPQSLPLPFLLYTWSKIALHDDLHSTSQLIPPYVKASLFISLLLCNLSPSLLSFHPQISPLVGLKIKLCYADICRVDNSVMKTIIHACTLVDESTGAPLSNSSSTKSLCPSLAARCNAFKPFCRENKQKPSI